jgi:DNA-binding MarR family transcriptional regulator
MTRWVARLRAAGLVLTTEDPTDGRRVFVSLSALGEFRMRDLLSRHNSDGVELAGNLRDADGPTSNSCRSGHITVVGV